MKGTQELRCELLQGDGKVVYDLNGLTSEDWDKSPRPARAASKKTASAFQRRPLRFQRDFIRFHSPDLTVLQARI